MAEAENETRIVTESGINRRVADIIEPVLTGMDFRLVRVRLSNQNGATLQIMVERNDGTMTVQDCEALSSAISPILDVVDPVDKAYHLEVSSPGIDRPLVRKSDFVRWRGHLAKIETSVIVDNRKRFRGKILSSDADGFIIEPTQFDHSEEVQITIPFSTLAEARLVLTDELVRDALRANKQAKSGAANQNEEADQV